MKTLVGVVDGQPLRCVLGRANAQSDFARFVCLIARMLVTYKGTVGAWNKQRGAADRIVASPWTQVLAGERGTPQHFFRPLPPDLVRALRYDGVKGPRARSTTRGSSGRPSASTACFA